MFNNWSNKNEYEPCKMNNNYQHEESTNNPQSCKYPKKKDSHKKNSHKKNSHKKNSHKKNSHKKNSHKKR